MWAREGFDGGVVGGVGIFDERRSYLWWFGEETKTIGRGRRQETSGERKKMMVPERSHRRSPESVVAGQRVLVN